MLPQVIEALSVKAGDFYVDATLGAAGHALGILAAAGGGVRVFGLDEDKQPLALSRRVLAGYQVRFCQENFQHLALILQKLNLPPANAILLDLGVSSMQLDQKERGFSFMQDAPLDMRMGEQPLNAANLLAQTSEENLTIILQKYGEEPYARPIARRLSANKVTSTGQLARLVEEALPAAERRRRKIHPATLVFQALRIAVNDELGALQRFLRQTPEILAPGGRLAVISYHSLEDRLVKQAFAAYVNPCQCPPALPLCVCGRKPAHVLRFRGAARASAGEVRDNPRARSARLRVLQAL
jgi:16S rRNA (cytosine1402-N4)-methyltransferase